MKFYEEYHYNEGQVFFDKSIAGLRFAAIMLIRIVVYLPLVVTGWMIASKILSKADSILLWVALILLFACLLYFVIYFIKGILITLKYHGNLLWIPLFICCTLFVCALPVYVLFDPLSQLTAHLSPKNNELLTWIFFLAFGLYVYSRYHFLTNIVPLAAYPYYQMGITVTVQLLRFKRRLKAGKSKTII